jgi:hypothetical protein
LLANSWIKVVCAWVSRSSYRIFSPFHSHYFTYQVKSTPAEALPDR